MFLYALCAVFMFILFICYLNGIYYHMYWKKRGVKLYSKNKCFGIFWDFIFKKHSTIDCIMNIYNEYKDEPAVGIGCVFIPGLFIIDPVNCLHVLQDEAFNCRPIHVNEHDILAKNNVLLTNGIKWRLIRQEFTSFFTTAKLKHMLARLNDTAIEFVHYLKTSNIKNETTWQTMQKFSAAAATSSMFGIRSQKIFDSPFLARVKQGFPPTTTSFIRLGIAIAAPFISKILRIKIFGKKNFLFMNLTRQLVQHSKEDNNSCYQDIIKNVNKKKSDEETGYEVEISDEVLAANFFFFCASSSLPSAAVLFCALYELAKTPRAQKNLRAEIDYVFTKYNGQISYHTMMEMNYLDQVYHEILRMYVGVSFVIRKCKTDAILPVGNITIAKGTLILVPTHAIQNDPNYVTDPHTFKPERFADGKLKKSPYFFPFGGGRRLCLGMRYTSFQVKTGLMHIVRNFKIEIHPNRNELKFLRNIFSLELDDMPLKLIPIDKY